MGAVEYMHEEQQRDANALKSQMSSPEQGERRNRSISFKKHQVRSAIGCLRLRGAA